MRLAFSIFGEVTNVSIPMDKETKRKRGFAFVEFEDYDAVDKACSKFVVICLKLLTYLIVNISTYWISHFSLCN